MASLMKRPKGANSKDKAAAAKNKEWEWLKRYKWHFLSIILFSLIITVMFPAGKSFQFADLREGRVYIGPEIIAPFTFPVNKSPEEYSADVKKARESIAPVFQRMPEVAQRQQQALEQFSMDIVNLLSARNTRSEDLHDLFQKLGIVMSEDDVNALLSGFNDQVLQLLATQAVNQQSVQKRVTYFRMIRESLSEVINEMFSAGILNVEKKDLASRSERISVRAGGQEMLEEMRYYNGPVEAQTILLERLRSNSEVDERQIKVAYQIAVQFLAPNLIFDEEETNIRIEDAIANVPLAKDQVLAGERIIDSHERISKQHIEKLNSFAMEKAERGESAGLLSRMIHGLGKFITTLIILNILLLFVYRNRRQVFDNKKQLLLIALVILLIVFFTFVANKFGISPYFIPVASGAMIITIFFDTYFGLFYAVSVSLLMGVMRGNEFSITYLSLVACTVSILSVSRVRARNWVLRSMAAIILTYFLATTVHDFLNYLSFREILTDWGIAFINGFISPILAYGLIILLEYSFDMTTDMTLLELSDLNHPLLRQMALQAPGTYHHSIMVGNMAEAATEAVGGNALMARVGAYYHDIGKLEKPEYFVENQAQGRNPQEKLTPTMSSLILLNHVRKGAEMARQFGLPKIVEAFIFQHHGTGLMSYFYQKALEQSSGDPISQTEFRYPGPRPKLRETAIVMLADAVEAASRTLKDPSPSRVKTFVENIIDERFKNNELDDSPLTLQDLSKISETFQKILNGLFHRRIEYPDQKENQGKTE